MRSALSPQWNRQNSNTTSATNKHTTATKPKIGIYRKVIANLKQEQSVIPKVTLVLARRIVLLRRRLRIDTITVIPKTETAKKLIANIYRSKIALMPWLNICQA